jgi:hypothetical protein
MATIDVVRILNTKPRILVDGGPVAIICAGSDHFKLKSSDAHPAW